MTRDDDFHVRPGRIRSSRAQRALPFVAQALAAAQRAGGRISRSGKITAGRGPHFARGRVASIRANRFITSRTRFCTVKALVVRNKSPRGPLARHLNYLRRDGVTRDGERAKMFGPETDDANVKEFTERCKDDRHHFRFIVSPEDASDMEDLKRFTRELMAQAEKDLGTIEAGKWADLVILDADPLADIRNTRRIWNVFQSGRLVDRQEIIKVIKPR